MIIKFLTIGRVSRPVGLRGRLEINSLTDFASHRFRPGQKVHLSPSLPHLQELTIEKAQLKGEQVILKFREMSSRTDVENIVGSFLQVRVEEAERLPLDAYWHHQIIGLKVVDLDDQVLGTVEEIIQTGGNDVYAIRGGKREILIPAIKEVVRKVNLEKKVMTVSLLPGL